MYDNWLRAIFKAFWYASICSALVKDLYKVSALIKVSLTERLFAKVSICSFLIKATSAIVCSYSESRLKYNF